MLDIGRSQVVVVAVEEWPEEEGAIVARNDFHFVRYVRASSGKFCFAADNWEKLPTGDIPTMAEVKEREEVVIGFHLSLAGPQVKGKGSGSDFVPK